MDPLILVVLVLVVGGAALIFTRQRQSQNPALAKKKNATSLEALDTVVAWPPQTTRILTASERKAYSVLRSALPEHIILAQVPLSRFMKVPTRNSYSEWLRRVGLMSVDIVVCDSSSQVIGVVDIRAGEGKENERARQRHARLDRVLEAAGIPVHIWLDNAIPTAAAAREMILGMAQGIAPASSTTSAMKSSPRGSAANMQPPVEPEALLDAEAQRAGREQRDPPPSTWFDNLDSGAMPLTPGPAKSPAPAPKATPYRHPSERR
jgi:hypothetical protein